MRGTVFSGLLDYDACIEFIQSQQKKEHLRIEMSQLKFLFGAQQLSELKSGVEHQAISLPQTILRYINYWEASQQIIKINGVKQASLLTGMNEVLMLVRSIKDPNKKQAMELYVQNMILRFKNLKKNYRENSQVRKLVRLILQVNAQIKKNKLSTVLSVEPVTLSVDKIRAIFASRVRIDSYNNPFDALSRLIEDFLDILQDLTLAFLMSYFFLQGYNPELHPLVFISTSARINREIDVLGNSQNHNGTILQLMWTLPLLIKDFLIRAFSIDRTKLQRIEFFRNLPLDKKDDDFFQINYGGGSLHDQSKMGLVLWATHLLSRRYHKSICVANAEVKTTALGSQRIIATFFDDLLMPARSQSGYQMQFAMQYLSQHPDLLPDNVELSIVGLLPEHACLGQSMFHIFIEQPLVGRGPTQQREAINAIVNTSCDFALQDRALSVKFWIFCCACAGPSNTSQWLHGLKNYEMNLLINRFDPHYGGVSAPHEHHMVREECNTPLLSDEGQSTALKFYNDKWKKNIGIDKLEIPMCDCEGGCGCFVNWSDFSAKCC